MRQDDWLLRVMDEASKRVEDWPKWKQDSEEQNTEEEQRLEAAGNEDARNSH